MKSNIIGLSLAYLSIPIFWMIFVFNIIQIKHLIKFGSFILLIFIAIICYNFYKYEIKK